MSRRYLEEAAERLRDAHLVLEQAQLPDVDHVDRLRQLAADWSELARIDKTRPAGRVRNACEGACETRARTPNKPRNDLSTE